MHDIVIRGGTIVDGTDKVAFTVDVAIADSRIAAVGGKLGPARREIDAAGLLVTPRLGRRAHALRRPGDVGPAARAFVLAWRHHGDVRQLRYRLCPGEETMLIGRRSATRRGSCLLRRNASGVGSKRLSVEIYV